METTHDVRVIRGSMRSVSTVFLSSQGFSTRMEEPNTVSSINI
jgi:hypothetical protein